MKNLEFNITIDASAKEVWDIVTGKDTYGQWTVPFSEGSSVETDWKKGSKALFHDGSGNGMISKIEDSIPGEFLSIRHIGMLKDGVEDTTSEEVKKWGNALENYTFKEIDGKTVWTVNVDVVVDFEEFMKKTFPPAMKIVKGIAEKS